MSAVIRHLRNAVLDRDAVGTTDAHLLGQFLAEHDEAAFEYIVRRHGPMVMGVCRRVLGDRHDAEDAFQATFLVLVRKADSVAPREMLANWLYGVAYQTALKARAMANKRQARERQTPEAPEPAAPPDEVHWRELRPIIDQELSRLPDKYRVPIVLCDLEERSYKEAAEQLGWREGTLAGRLFRARKMLADRLARRGVVLSAGLLATVLSQNAASGSVPTALVVPTVKAANLFAAGNAAAGGIPPQVAAIAEGVLKAMTLTKLKIVTAVVLASCLVVSGVCFALAPAGQQENPKKAEQPQDKKGEVKKDEKKDDKKDALKNGNGQNQNGNGQNNQNNNGQKNQNDDGQKNQNDDGQKNQKDDGQQNQGAVKAVDPDGNSVTVTLVGDGGVAVDRVFALPKNVPVVVGGKPGKVADLKPGMRVGVTLDKDNVVGVKELPAANGQKNPKNDGKNNGK